MAVTTPLLRGIDLGIGYGDTVIGRRLNMAVSPGEVFCLLGPNGSGKTTLFKTLLGLIPAQSGTVHVSGSNIQTLKRDEFARRVAYVPQAHAAHFPFIVRDMVVMGRTAHQGMFAQPSASDCRMADDALARLGIAALADRDYTRLSGGQRQLVLIARALAQSAPVIVMDEPTASLDFGNQVLVLREVARLAASGLAVVLSTHDPDHAFAVAHQVALLHEGALIASGPPTAVLTPQRLAQVYGITVTVERLAGGQTVCVPKPTG
jgi:iron complex transport system ATP-binding protein